MTITTKFNLPFKGNWSQPGCVKAWQEFPTKLQEIHQGRIVLRDTAVYVHNKIHIDVKCTVCGNEWRAAPSNLIRAKRGCPKCVAIRARKSAGTMRSPRASKAEKELVKRMRSTGMSINAIAKIVGRSNGTVHRWIDPVEVEKNRERSRISNPLRSPEMRRAYRKTPHAKAIKYSADHKRRALEYHAIDDVLIDGVWHDIDVYEYITTDEDRAFWSWDGADEDCAKRKLQQSNFAKISGEKYSLEHLIPLSRGGIHHPMNFANRALKLNIKKNNSIWSSDVELFCKRLFNI